VSQSPSRIGLELKHFSSFAKLRSGGRRPLPGKPLVCSRIRELQETLSPAVIALEISSRSARVLALQKRWDRLRDALERLLDERGADMIEIPGGSTGILCRDDKGKEADHVPVHDARRVSRCQSTRKSCTPTSGWRN
jgi:hypothetical protein